MGERERREGKLRDRETERKRTNKRESERDG
jgi:hypothetical protein